jgi:hypothetical protein
MSNVDISIIWEHNTQSFKTTVKVKINLYYIPRISRNITRDRTLNRAVLHDAEPYSDYFGQMGGRAAAAIEGASLRDLYPFISATRIAEARAEARRVMTYLEKHVFPIHGVISQPI